MKDNKKRKGRYAANGRIKSIKGKFPLAKAKKPKGRHIQPHMQDDYGAHEKPVNRDSYTKADAGLENLMNNHGVPRKMIGWRGKKNAKNKY